jgi:sialic acid synthase SpsE
VADARLDIGGRPVGHGEPAFFIAEIGLNHNGDTEIA